MNSSTHIHGTPLLSSSRLTSSIIKYLHDSRNFIFLKRNRYIGVGTENRYLKPLGGSKRTKALGRAKICGCPLGPALIALPNLDVFVRPKSDWKVNDFSFRRNRAFNDLNKAGYERLPWNRACVLMDSEENCICVYVPAKIIIDLKKAPGILYVPANVYHATLPSGKDRSGIGSAIFTKKIVVGNCAKK